MKKVIFVIVICLTLCGCGKKEDDIKILERTIYNNSENIKKENIYGCWKFNKADAYLGKQLLYDGDDPRTINFYENNLEYCYYDVDIPKCEMLNYKINNNRLEIESNDVLDEYFTLYMYEKDKILDFTMETTKDDIKYIYHMKYTKECKLDKE